ncbi:MAG: contractile injection system protein, VgrG/Pvc8 family [Pseudomonadota bacterium]
MTQALERITLDSLSESLRGFYVPEFTVLVEGAGLPDDVMRDVIQVTYDDDLEKMDTFQITVSNWDEVNKQYKYIGSEDAAALEAGDAGQSETGSEQTRRYQLFEPCSKKVTVKMGYAGDKKTMINGYFTTMEPSFNANGAATLTVRGINAMQRLRTKKYNDFYENQKPSEIVGAIRARVDQDLNALRFPIDVSVSQQALENERSIVRIAQKNEYDIDFMWKLARRYGYLLRMEEPEQEGDDPNIYFGPSQQGDALINAVYELKLNQSLIEFNPRITTANQFKSVTVNGWNRDKQEMISETVSFEDEEMKEINTDLHYLLCMCDAREELVVDEPVFNEAQAKDRAKALLLDQQKQMVTVSATTVGLPLLKAGTKVRIAEVGERLSGEYFVTKTQHIFNDSGYITKFDARRENMSNPRDVPEC